MPFEVYLMKTLTGLKPVSRDDEEKLGKFKFNETFRASITRPRNVAHHNKYRALLQVVVDNCDFDMTTKQLNEFIKEGVGLGEFVTFPNGERKWVNGSTSFESMGQDEFDEFYPQALAFICRRVIPGLVEEDLQIAVLNEISHA